jgi:three-Cys-motif partner protein
VAYRSEPGLFGPILEKEDTQTIAEAYRRRLQTAAGFQYVPEPIPMRNSKGAVVYYLFFAAQKPVAADIVADIFRKYRDRRPSNG